MGENQAKNDSPDGETTADESSEPIMRVLGEAGGGKTAWPELVGESAAEAERKVKQDMPIARVKVLPPGSPVTMDFWTDRVRLHVDSNGIVIMPPTVG